MVALCSRRSFTARTLGLAVVLPLFAVGIPLSDRTKNPSQLADEETYYWAPTGGTRCIGGLIEEEWCYYECAGTLCTPLYYEWRPTNRPCQR